MKTPPFEQDAIISQRNAKEEDEARFKAEEESKRIVEEKERKRKEAEEKRIRKLLNPFAMENFPEPPSLKAKQNYNAENSKARSNEGLPDPIREAAIKRLKTELEESNKLKQRRIAASEENCYCEIADKFTQENEQILDHTGRRWIKCEICHKIKPADEFKIYGGINHINSGKCRECYNQEKNK